MNKEYIKRQLTLMKLGIPISDDIKKEYDKFCVQIKYLDSLKKMKHKKHPHATYWINDTMVCSTYTSNSKTFFIKGSLWDCFTKRNSRRKNETSALISAMLETYLNIEVDTTENIEYYVIPKSLRSELIPIEQ